MRSSFVRRSSLGTVFIVVGLLAGLFGDIGTTHAQGSVIYVVPGGLGRQDGSSWANAKDLQAALTGATSGSQLWVKAGTYTATTDGDRTATFALKTGVAVYGGFAGTETQLSQRNAVANVTRLSGEIGAAGNADNSYHVVMGGDTDATALLDGVTISGGNANGDSPNDIGGGVYNNASSPTLANMTIAGNAATYGGGVFNESSNPTLRNVTISANTASAYGGGMFNYTSTPMLTNSTISANTAEAGGGLFNQGSSPELTSVTFSSNTATKNGGGLYNTTSNPMLRNVTITDNTATGDGGGIYNYDSNATLTHSTISANTASAYGGGMFNYTSTPMLTNSTISANTAEVGGGVVNEGSSPALTSVTISGNTASVHGGGMLNRSAGGMFNRTTSDPTLTNVTISGNSAQQKGGGLYNWDFSTSTLRNVTIAGNAASDGGGIATDFNSSTYVDNSILWGNTGGEITNGPGSSTAVWRSIVRGGYGGNGILNVDPLFVAAVPTAPSTGGDLRLQPTSPAINAGDNNELPSGVITDLDGNPRIMGPAVDLGAYENQQACGNLTQLFITSVGQGYTNGESWANSTSNLQAALARARLCPAMTQVWVAKGTYTPGEDRAATFTLRSGLAIYGGFAGTETALSQRNIAANVTRLSGEIGATGNADNSYHVVTGSGTDANARLDGVTVSGGNANGSSPNDSGGGVYINGSNPTLANITISGNSASIGGGVYNTGSSPTLANVTVSGNAAGFGGGVYNYNSNPMLVNVTVSGNTAGIGGLFNNGSSPLVHNSIVWGNTGGQIANGPGSNPTVRTSIVQGGYAGGSGILTVDPLFVAAVPAAPSTGGDLRLQTTSPAINAGDNSLVPSGTLTDRDGNLRVQGSTVDLGAYEKQECGSPTRLFVTTSTQGFANGESWANSMSDLQAALARARLCPAMTQVWVAKGTYTPGEDRSATFTLRNGLAIYGGFAGTETALSQRNIAANVTRLSGEIGATGNEDNSYHVVTGGGTNATARLDGITISGGNADTESPNDSGGGVYNTGSSPTLANVTISGNSATYGGGIYNSGSSPLLSNVIISANETARDGAGMFNNSSSPRLINVTISANTVSIGKGGGMFNSGSNPALTNTTISGNAVSFGDGGGLVNANGSNPVLTNVTISGNQASDDGGGLYNHLSRPVLRNVTVSGNTATYGGGMLNNQSSPMLVNVTISGNTAPEGGALYNHDGSNPALRNSIVWSNSSTFVNDNSTPDVQYSIIQGGHAGVGNINADPRFVTAVPTAPSRGGNLRLQAGSPAVNAGNNSFVPADVTTDRDGKPRVVAITVDMGAFERQTAQAITFAPVAPKTYGDSPFAVSATASSSLPVTLTASGVCTIAGTTVTLTGAGICTITATQAGDATHDPAQARLTIPVARRATTTTLQSSANPSLLGQATTFAARITAASGGTPTGTVTFKDGATVLGTATLSSGTATFATATLSAGTHTIVAVYGGSATHASSARSLSQVVRNASTTTLTSSLNPSRYGQSVTFTAQVSGSAGVPSGTVTFLDGATVLRSFTLNGGQAALTLSTLSVGTHTITARYNGNAVYAPDASPVLSQVVRNVSTTTLTSSLNPSRYGQSVTFTAQVSGGAGVAAGTVTFLDGATVLRSFTLSGGQATFTLSTLSVGNHTITARYNGNAVYAPSTSPVLTQSVAKAVTTTTLQSSANPSTAGQAVTFTAKVTAASGGTPTGTVTFKDGADILGTATLSSGTATLSAATLSAGTHTIVAAYGGNATDASSAGSLSHVVR